MALNIFGKDAWATKITSMLEDSYTQYDGADYDGARAMNEWIIAEENGSVREALATGPLKGAKFNVCFHGLDDLKGVTHGAGLVVGEGSLIRTSAILGDQVYVGANCTIDINTWIGSYTTIGDNVVIGDGVRLDPHSVIPSGSIILE